MYVGRRAIVIRKLPKRWQYIHIIIYRGFPATVFSRVGSTRENTFALSVHNVYNITQVLFVYARLSDLRLYYTR